MDEDAPASPLPHAPEPDPSSALTRRRFLHTAGIVGAGVALVPRGAAARSIEGASEGASARHTRLGPARSDFDIRVSDGGITSLRYARDSFDTDYIQPGGRLGDLLVRYRRDTGAWRTVETAARADARTTSRSADGAEYVVTHEIAEGAEPVLALESRFTVHEHAVTWTISVTNRSGRPLEIGDLAIPLAMNTHFGRGQPATATVLKHSFVSGHGSFMFWMRSNSVGPYLTLTPRVDTSLEYWEATGGYRVYIHSAVSGAVAAEHGCRWRQPHTTLTLAPAGAAGDARSYGFTLQWARDYDAVRQLLVDAGLIDVHVVPGMTVPSDLAARIALRTTQRIEGIDAEFPDETTIARVEAPGDAQVYEVHFARLGENRLTVRLGGGRHMHLEFFSTEPLETLIAKRAAFIAAHQHRDPTKWYDGLLAEWNMDDHVMLGPDNYDRIEGWRIYEVTCDDPGLSRPAFLAAKSAEHPVQREVEALDYYIERFVWGGLQRTTDETYAYGIYGIPDWKTNRESHDTGRNGQRHLWRIYDYPHVVVMYFGMYRVAKHHPHIRCALPAEEYLRRAYGTALAMFTIPREIEGWSAYGTGLYNELVIVELIAELHAAGMTAESDTLRRHWERKVHVFVNEKPDLFQSEYAFDSTGFESTHAIARYAVLHASTRPADGDGDTGLSGITPAKARRFMETQLAANIFCRGWLEPAYYYLGSDYRGGGGDRYTLTYMAQMGGWSVLDYALHFAEDPSPYLRLGYASYLSAWALVNSGTPASDYGYWYPGAANDGGAGGGFEPAPYGATWLEQPHHRGSWYYSCEINLGYCGARRSAATVLADDPIFGRSCYGGTWHATDEGIAVEPRDGVRRRFHALLRDGRVHLESEVDRFASSRPIVVAEDLSRVHFQLESDNPGAHVARLRLSGVAPGRYAVRAGRGHAVMVEVRAAGETVIEVPVSAGGRPVPVSIERHLDSTGE